MASLLFVVVKFLKLVDTPYDVYWLLLLLALELPAYLNTYRLWRLRR